MERRRFFAARPGDEAIPLVLPAQYTPGGGRAISRLQQHMSGAIGRRGFSIELRRRRHKSRTQTNRRWVGGISSARGGVPSTFVPGRNILFLTLAAIYAYQVQTHTLITGVCETDFSGYPDCRDEFVRALIKSVVLGMDYQLKIETPLMWLGKGEWVERTDKCFSLDAVIFAARSESSIDALIRRSYVNTATRITSSGWHRLSVFRLGLRRLAIGARPFPGLLLGGVLCMNGRAP